MKLEATGCSCWYERIFPVERDLLQFVSSLCSLKPLFPGPPPSRRSLQRTLSDESIYSGQRESSAGGQRDSFTNPLFTCSTIPRSPITRHGASRRAPHKSLGESLRWTHDAGSEAFVLMGGSADKDPNKATKLQLVLIV